MMKVDEHPYNDGGDDDANIDCSISGTLEELILSHPIAKPGSHARLTGLSSVEISHKALL